MTAGDGTEADWLGVPMFFGGIGAAATLRAVQDAGLVVLQSEIVVERLGDGSAERFLWVSADKPQVEWLFADQRAAAELTVHVASVSGVALTPLDRVREICLALPEVTERISHGTPTFFVRGKKSFCWYWDDLHGDGMLSLWCAAPPGAQEEMLREDPKRFFRPPYVGKKGWLGVRVDGRPNWTEVRAVIEEAYRTIAPKSLANQLDAR